MRHTFIISFTLLLFNLTNAQNSDYSVQQIPDNLKENANSVVRNQLIDVNIASQKNITIKTEKVITVFNKNGLLNIDAKEYYGKSTKVVLIEATILNALGSEVKKIRKKEFIDQSVLDGFSVITDRRVVFLDYTPIDYPFTIVYKSEVQSSNTASIPGWYIIDDYFESVQKSQYKISYPSGLGFKYKEFNVDGRNIKKTEQSNSISYLAENSIAEKPEEYSPDVNKIFPSVLFALDKFYYEGVEGTTKSWEEHGAWVYDAMLKDTEELSDETKNKIKTLVGDETNPIEKAKIIYKYVQDKTRYVSIQLGIGGWKPMLAKDVDRLGYGDCKALSNYTRVLLKSVGVESYYTEIYGGGKRTDFEKDFVSVQGNHIVLALPNKDKMIFLECTSQTNPFGYQGTFTDDRYALLIKPDKGEIIKTNEYSPSVSTQISKGNYTIGEKGDLSGSVIIKSKGIQYSGKYHLETDSKDNVNNYYKDYFSWINNLKLEKIKFNNDKENVEFTEDLKLNAVNYANLSGATMMIPINAFNQNPTIPQRYRTRKNPFEVSRGYSDEDQVEINLPQGFVLESKPDNFEINDKFGTYKAELIVVNPTKLLYKRNLLINKGYYEKTEYENFRKFKEQIARADNSKIVITKNN